MSGIGTQVVTVTSGEGCHAVSHLDFTVVIASTETPIPPTETPIPPTETLVPPTETLVPPTETATNTATVTPTVDLIAEVAGAVDDPGLTSEVQSVVSSLPSTGTGGLAISHACSIGWLASV